MFLSSDRTCMYEYIISSRVCSWYRPVVRRGHGVGGCGGQLGALRLGAVDGGDERSDGRERGCRARAFGGRDHQGAATPEHRRRPACSSASHVIGTRRSFSSINTLLHLLSYVICTSSLVSLSTVHALSHLAINHFTPQRLFIYLFPTSHATATATLRILKFYSMHVWRTELAGVRH